MKRTSNQPCVGLLVATLSVVGSEACGDSDSAPIEEAGGGAGADAGVGGIVGSAGTAGSASTAGVGGSAGVAGSAGAATSPYTYAGCNVYAANDWFTTNLVTGGSSYAVNTVDPDSSAIINNLDSIYGIIAWNGDVIDAVNIATDSTPMHVINGLQTNGFADDPYNDDPEGTFPFETGFYAQGQQSPYSGCQHGDCHVTVLNTDRCLAYDSYAWGVVPWDGSAFHANSAYVHNLSHPFNDQYTQDGSRTTAAGLPLLGTTDFGEEASASSINHIIGFILPTNNQGTQGYVAPATSSASCSIGCAHPLPLGARLRLKSSFACPPASSYLQSSLVCNQLKTYGMILLDYFANTCTANEYGHGGDCYYGLRFGQTASNNGGSNPWKRTPGDPSLDLNQIFWPTNPHALHITDFEVMTLGTIH
jgi:hypothetical protein